MAVGVPTPDGFQVLVPDGSGWVPIATFAVPGLTSRLWLGELCVTGSGNYAGVAFAPIESANREAVLSAGAFAGTVDLRDGSQWFVPQRVMLRYHSPGCGADDRIVFSRYSSPDEGSTELFTVDPSSKTVLRADHVDGQITSAVPYGEGVAGVAGGSVVSIDSSGVSSMAALGQWVYDLHPNAASGVDAIAVKGSTAVAVRIRPGSPTTTLASAPLGHLRIAPGRAGHNRLVGHPQRVDDRSIEVVPAESPVEAVSLDASLVIDRVTGPDAEPSAGVVVRSHAPGGAERSDRAHARSSTSAGGDQPPRVKDGAARPHGMTTQANITTPKCAVPKADYQNQVLQPTPAQVEWAAHRAVRGLLTFTRPANWQLHGSVGSYSPNSLFPRTSYLGSKHVPVQILEGLAALESNMDQASGGALPGVAGDPLIGDYFGTAYDANGRIVGMDYDKADCGYGITQITDYMTAASTVLTAQQKAAIAYDYTANFARAVQVLEQKWHELQVNGIVANDGDSDKIENWYLTLWSYNTGFHAQSGTSPWGLGWTNNPANHDYDPSRQPFLRGSYDDAAHPQRWPYQEKVLGWAERAQIDYQGNNKYTAAGALALSTNYTLYCDVTANQCDPNYVNQSNPSLSYCTRSDRQCWWHNPVSWTLSGKPEDASSYAAGAAEPAAANPQPPDCSVTTAPIDGAPTANGHLPSNAVVVDDLPNTQWNLVGCPAQASAGSFQLTFANDTSGAPLSKIDFHQLGTGYGGHFWYAHTIAPGRVGMDVTGKWTPPSTVVGWQQVYVHIPVTGADTFQADYTIYNGAGTSYHRVVNQRWNENSWIDLGSFLLSSGAYVSLTNFTYGDWRNSSSIDIAWDAMAFVPSSKPTVSYVALGDSYAAGEGVEPYYKNADNGKSTAGHVNKCHRSPQGYGALLASDLYTRHPGGHEFHYLACSGAVTASLLGNSALGRTLDGSDEQWGEVPQLLQGWLDENTTHVSVGIGGNDAGFGDILKGCMVTVHDCTDGSFRLTRNGQTDPDPLVTTEPSLIQSLQPVLEQVLTAIHQQAPNAQVVFVGYPHVVSNSGARGFPCSAYYQDTVDWFAQMGDLMTQTMQAAASNVATTAFADVRSAFSGHEACTPTGPEWVNAVIASSDSGSGLDMPGTGTFHPKASGHQADETVLATKVT